jgi:hypothetical protein
LLGPVLYNQFVLGLYTDGNVSTPIPEVDILQKWKDLRDGKAYAYKSKDYRYTGLKKFLVPYIYSEWTNDHVYSNTNTGVSRPRKENADMVDPSYLIIKSWNDFARLVEGSGLYYNRGMNTLWGFLESNKLVDYPDWKFKCPGRKNNFGI